VLGGTAGILPASKIFLTNENCVLAGKMPAVPVPITKD